MWLGQEAAFGGRVEIIEDNTTLFLTKTQATASFFQQGFHFPVLSLMFYVLL